MSTLTRFDATDPRFPSRLRELPAPPDAVWVRGTLAPRRVLAIVGSREPAPEALRFAKDLAAAIARCGAVVASGGAKGIDAGAHRAAMDAGGVTWVVVGTGLQHAYPPEHAGLFAEVVERGGALLSTFAPEAKATRTSFLQRNGLLASLAEAVVVAQAGLPSGALSTAAWARRLARPLYVVSFPAWASAGFEGSALELRAGARPLVSIDAFLADVRLAGAARPPDPRPGPERALSELELALLAAIESSPLHTDEIAERCAAPSRTVQSALLTLALENVVVEGPAGFFRRV